MNAQPLEWFRSLSEVPGVPWHDPEGIILDPRFAGAQPVVDPRRSFQTAIAWVDTDGHLIGDEYMPYRSPAELTLERRFEISDPDKAVLTMCQALALPGTRSDYHTALSWLSEVRSVPSAWVERALEVDVRLVLADPVAAVTSRWVDDSDMALSQASRPILRLMELYVREGFLVEAAEVERLLDRLPDAAHPRYEYGPRPSHIAESLRSLAA